MACLLIEAFSIFYLNYKRQTNRFLDDNVMQYVDNYLKYINHSRYEDYPDRILSDLKPINLMRSSIFAYTYYKFDGKRQYENQILLQGASWFQEVEFHSIDIFNSMDNLLKSDLVFAGTS